MDSDICQGAGDCYEVCPAEPKVYELRQGKSFVAHPEACILCGACEVSCPFGAIKLE